MESRHLLMAAMAIAACGALVASQVDTRGAADAAGSPSTARPQDLASRALPASQARPTDSARWISSVGNGPQPEQTATPDTTTGGVAPRLDWHRYPGTLDSQAHQALATRDGAMAMDLANKLMECDLVTRGHSSPSRQVAGPQLAPAAHAEWVKLQQEEQRLVSNCQTIAVGDQDMRSRLLELALEQKVVGSGIELFANGVRRPDVLQGVAADAAAGDVKSLVFATAYQAQFFGLTADAQNALRYGFELASKDPQVGQLVRRYYDNAQAFSGPMGGTAHSKFDSSSISESAKTEGAALAGRIVQRIKANG